MIFRCKRSNILLDEKIVRQANFLFERRICYEIFKKDFCGVVCSMHNF